MFLSGFERRGQPIAPRLVFLRRLGTNLGLAGLVILGSLVAGMLGYVGFEGMSLVDAFVNAAMILSGMGPIGELHTAGGKIFAGAYALYSGLLVIGLTGFMLAPVVHRVLHSFSLPSEDDDAAEEKEEESGKGEAQSSAGKPSRKSAGRSRASASAASSSSARSRK